MTAARAAQAEQAAKDPNLIVPCTNCSSGIGEPCSARYKYCVARLELLADGIRSGGILAPVNLTPGQVQTITYGAPVSLETVDDPPKGTAS